jgi:hypothetical protein
MSLGSRHAFGPCGLGIGRRDQRVHHAEKNGAIIKAEGSQDFHQQQTAAGQQYLSAKFIHEFDCEKKQARQLSLSTYPENMANGGVLQTDNEAKPWAAPIAGSAVEMMWKKACVKP